jgi:hypothetical protein
VASLKGEVFPFQAVKTYRESRGIAPPEERRPLGRPRRRWVDNIKMDFQEVRWEAWTGFS